MMTKPKLSSGLLQILDYELKACMFGTDREERNKLQSEFTSKIPEAQSCLSCSSRSRMLFWTHTRTTLGFRCPVEMEHSLGSSADKWRNLFTGRQLFNEYQRTTSHRTAT